MMKFRGNRDEQVEMMKSLGELVSRGAGVQGSETEGEATMPSPVELYRRS